MGSTIWTFQSVKKYIYTCIHLNATFFELHIYEDCAFYVITKKISIYKIFNERVSSSQVVTPTKNCSMALSLQKEVVTRVQVLKERLSEKTKETWGRWMTVERMRKDKDLNLSSKSIQNIVNYCSKFPETLKRQGLTNHLQYWWY